MLKGIYRTKFEITLLTGLHIGGSSDTFDIGGADSTVIKNPLTNEPYIPGSSIKGKLRSLLTQKYGELNDSKDEIIFSKDKRSQTLLNLFEPVDFGTDTIQTSKAIFRDAYLTEESKKDLQKHLGDGIFTEVKAENKIDLLKGKAANPRFIERVPAGAVFETEIILHVYDGDDEKVLKQGIEEGLHMLELNYLGGSGTRGYGRVQVQKLVDMEEVEF